MGSITTIYWNKNSHSHMIESHDWLKLNINSIIPVFEGLFLEEHKHHKKAILDTLFLLATCHACAKLHLRMDKTLESFEQLTAPLGVISISLLTCKLYALGDYAQTIHQYGTVDSYSSNSRCFVALKKVFNDFCREKNVSTDESNVTGLIQIISLSLRHLQTSQDANGS
jgi:hypothetical protein